MDDITKSPIVPEYTIEAGGFNGAFSTTKSLSEKFTDFFNTRDNAKKAIYYKVISLGYLIGIIGGICLATGFIGTAFANDFYYKNHNYYIFDSLDTIGCFGISLGIMLLSTVPTDEVEFDDIIGGLASRKYLFTFIFTGVYLVCGIFASVVPPFIPGLLLLLLVAVMIYHLLLDTYYSYCKPASYTNQYFLTSKISVGIILTQIAVGSVLIYLGADIVGFINNSFISDTLMNNGWRETISIRQENLVEFQLVYISQGVVMLLSGVISGIYFCRTILAPYIYNDSVVKGIATKCLYFVLYAILFAGSFICLVTGIMLSYHSLYVSTHANAAVFSYLQAFFMAAPLLSVIILGRDHFFSLMAISFELNISRLQKDGSLLAELASQANINIAVGNYRFWHRINDNVNFKNSVDEHIIDRSKWMKGEIIVNRPVESGIELCVKYSYHEDLDLNWYCKFTNDKLESKEGNNNPMKIIPDQLSFDEWVKMYFDTTNDNIKVVRDDKIVLITEIVQSSNKSASEMLIWARNNLRSFSFENFYDELLKFSPRELKTNDDRVKTYALSKPVELITSPNHCQRLCSRFNDDDDASDYSIKKINYFISHSWMDNSEIKIKKLREFSHNHYVAHQEQPTYWFDKVCIDQADPKNALLSLPINIGACEKLLILLGNTYLKRIWCIWELYTIFSFCNKELAASRIEVVLIEDESGESVENTIQVLKKFDINNCHCYGPDEEMKLRCIIYEVGIERLKHGIATMASILEDKLKKKLK